MEIPYSYIRYVYNPKDKTFTTKASNNCKTITSYENVNKIVDKIKKNQDLEIKQKKDYEKDSIKIKEDLEKKYKKINLDNYKKMIDEIKTNINMLEKDSDININKFDTESFEKKINNIVKKYNENKKQIDQNKEKETNNIKDIEKKIKQLKKEEIVNYDATVKSNIFDKEFKKKEIIKKIDLNDNNIYLGNGSKINIDDVCWQAKPIRLKGGGDKFIMPPYLL